MFFFLAISDFTVQKLYFQELPIGTATPDQLLHMKGEAARTNKIPEIKQFGSRKKHSTEHSVFIGCPARNLLEALNLKEFLFPT